MFVWGVADDFLLSQSVVRVAELPTYDRSSQKTLESHVTVLIWMRITTEGKQLRFF